MANPRHNLPQPSSTDDRSSFTPKRDKEKPEPADSSASLFAMYCQMAEKEHKETAERWQKDADGILIFTGLFSAAVGVLAAVTVPDLKQPNSQDTSAYYLRNIYLLLASVNGSHPSILDVTVDPPPLYPLNYVKWVNSLWFLSLSISLTSAMLATILQQCARRYLRITQRPQYSPHDGARIRAFFSRGIDVMLFPWLVEVIPTLIHISLFLFFSGLLVYLFNVNHFVFCAVVWWIGAFATLYLVITIMPILRLDSPYHTSPSPLVFWVYAAISYWIFLLLPRLSKFGDTTLTRLHRLADKYFAGQSQGMEKMAEVHVRKPSPKLDGFILKWTFDAHSLASDRQLDEFFECLLAFTDSDRIAPDSLPSLATLRSGEFSSAMVAFLNRTLSSDEVTNPYKIERFLKCVKVADATRATALGDLSVTVRNVIQTIEIGRVLRPRGSTDEEIGLCAQTIVADIIAKVPRDDNWVELASDQLGKSPDAIRRYHSHGNDSVLLANLIHITRQIFKSSSGITQDMAGNAASYILKLPPTFAIRNTLPELQHDFCALWNDIVPKAKKRGDSSIPHFILYLICNHYTDLHQGTGDAPTDTFDDFKISSYPSCDNLQHRPAETPPDPVIHTSSHASNVSPPSHVSDPPASTVPPDNNTISRSQHVDDANTTPQHVTIITSDPPLSATMPDPSNESVGPPPGQASSSQIASIQVDPEIHPASDPSDNTAIAVAHEDTHNRSISSRPELACQLETPLPDIVITIPGDASEHPPSGKYDLIESQLCRGSSIVVAGP